MNFLGVSIGATCKVNPIRSQGQRFELWNNLFFFSFFFFSAKDEQSVLEKHKG